MDIYWCYTYLETFLDLSVSLSVCKIFSSTTSHLDTDLERKESCLDLTLIVSNLDPNTGPKMILYHLPQIKLINL